VLIDPDIINNSAAQKVFEHAGYSRPVESLIHTRSIWECKNVSEHWHWDSFHFEPIDGAANSPRLAPTSFTK